MKRLYLIRHGETLENEAGIMIGTGPGNLSEKGITQTKMLADHLQKFDLNLIISSPLKRARETSEIINRSLNLPVIFSDIIVERELGELSGIMRSDWERLWEMQEDKINFRPAGGESYMDILTRVKLFLEYISGLNEENILVVTHGRFLKILLNHLKGEDLLKPIAQDNCCINVLTYDDNFRIQTENFSFNETTKHYAGALVVKDGKVLLGLRPIISGIKYPGFWSTFGGRVECGENARQAVMREINEELGVNAVNCRLFLQHPHLEYTNIFRHMYICELDEYTNFKYTEEIDSRWFGKNDYAAPKLTPSTRYCMDLFFKISP
ncbi:MAG: histidine phosphatase family protein [Candidatus Woesearchaeota archaeon]